MLLSTDIWVAALIRRAELSGAFGMVIRKGDARAGAVLVKVLNRPQGTANLYAEATRLDGERVWMAGARIRNDLTPISSAPCASIRDIWVVEIDDRQGRR